MASANQSTLALADVDAEYAAILQTRGKLPPLAGDIHSLRSVVASAATFPSADPLVAEKVISIPTSSGVAIDVEISKLASGSTAGPLVCWFHGGGCILRTPTWTEARSFVHQFGAVVISPQYRLAPEAKFPAQAEDALDAVRWAVDHATDLGADLNKGFIVGGTSSGAKLALVSAYRARDEGLKPGITGLMIQMPQVVAAEFVPQRYASMYLSWEQCKDADCLNRDSIEFYEGLSLPDKASTLHSPLLDEKGHAGLPATFLQVCGWDPHRDDGLILEDALRTADVPERSVVYPGLPHGFFALAPDMKVSQKWRQDTVEGMRWLLELRK